MSQTQTNTVQVLYMYTHTYTHIYRNTHIHSYIHTQYTHTIDTGYKGEEELGTKYLDVNPGSAIKNYVAVRKSFSVMIKKGFRGQKVLHSNDPSTGQVNFGNSLDFSKLLSLNCRQILPSS